jgi:hypothetical protein
MMGQQQVAEANMLPTGFVVVWNVAGYENVPNKQKPTQICDRGSVVKVRLCFEGGCLTYHNDVLPRCSD